MNRLVAKECEHSQDSMPPLTHGRIQPLAMELGNWEVMNDHHLSRTFRFLDFEDAIAFVDKVGCVAEREEHYPDISISYNSVRIDIWTHAIDGLSENDFILAAKINHLLHR